eukprot:23939_1
MQKMTTKATTSHWLLLAVFCLAVLAYGTNRYGLIPIQDQIIDYYDISDIDYNLLQSLYSWPNVVTCVVCGILCDKFGVNTMLFSSWSIMIIGDIIVILSAQNTYTFYWLLCIGRTIIGIGCESFNIAGKVFCWNQFNPKKHGVIFGIINATAALSSAANNIFIYQIYKLVNSIQITFLIQVIIIVCVSIPLFVYIFYNKQKESISSSESDTTNLLKPETKNKFYVSDIKSLSLYYWMLLLSYCFLEVSVQSFSNIGVSFYHHMYGYSYSLSSILASTPTFVAVIGMPLFGYITDKYGMKCRFMICSGMIMIIVHWSLGWLHIDIILTVITLFLFGVAVSMLYPVIWSAIPIVVNANIIATALGVITSFRFVCLAIGYILVGVLTQPNDGNGKYENVQYFEMCTALLSVIFAILLFKLDQKNGNKLYYPTNSIKRITVADNNKDDIKCKNIELNA